MSLDNIDIFEEVSNPLDAVEDLFNSYEWSFRRNGDDELSVQVAGNYEAYELSMIWDEESNCLQFLAQYSFAVAEENLDIAARALMRINERLWLGHFILTPGTNAPALRHTSLFRGFFHGSGAEQIEDLVDIAIKEAEQYHPVFEWLSQPISDQDNSPLDLILMRTAGES